LLGNKLIVILLKQKTNIMALFQSGNPALSENKFTSTVISDVLSIDVNTTMTVKGTLNKFGLLFLLTLASAYFTWKEFVGGGDV
jgi:hypothetical protein